MQSCVVFFSFFALHILVCTVNLPVLSVSLNVVERNSAASFAQRKRRTVEVVRTYGEDFVFFLATRVSRQHQITGPGGTFITQGLHSIHLLHKIALDFVQTFAFIPGALMSLNTWIVC